VFTGPIVSADARSSTKLARHTTATAKHNVLRVIVATPVVKRFAEPSPVETAPTTWMDNSNPLPLEIYPDAASTRAEGKIGKITVRIMPVA
jgi:hypothetical protein